MKGWPIGYGFYGSCALCPERENCKEGSDCKIFKPRPKQTPIETDCHKQSKLKRILKIILE